MLVHRKRAVGAGRRPFTVHRAIVAAVAPAANVLYGGTFRVCGVPSAIDPYVQHGHPTTNGTMTFSINKDFFPSLGYGLGYAYARDNLRILAREIVTARGNEAKYFGASTPLNFAGYTPVTNGPTYMQTITWDDNGVVVPEAILGFSQSDDPENPHYSDQTERYSRKEFRRRGLGFP